MNMPIYSTYDLYERMVENQFTWPTKREISQKIVVIHNIDVVTTLAAQMELLTKKLDNLTQSVNMVYQPIPICRG